MNDRLTALFQPKTIAVVGASRDGLSVGSTILQNLQKGKFSGTIFPVHKTAGTLEGLRAYPSITDIPESVDLGIIAIPKAGVSEVLTAMGKKGLGAVVIITAGFGETGAEGKKEEEALKTICQTYHMVLLGPNCLGVIHPHEHINASFGRTDAIPGSIAFLSQSGAVGAALLDIGKEQNIGFSHFISFGNMAGVTELDILSYLKHDEKTKAIGMYVEQLSDAKRYIETVRSLGKPVVVLKAGKSNKGREAAASHTGALAGSATAYDALFKQSNTIAVDSTEEFLATLTAFTRNPKATGQTCAIVTNAGGPAILATDAGEEAGITFPSVGTLHNPIDLLGDATPDAYKKTLETVCADPTINAVYSIITPQTTTDVDAIASIISDARKTSHVPFAASCMGGVSTKKAVQILNAGNVFQTPYPELGMKALGHVLSFYKKTSAETEVPQKKSVLKKNTLDPIIHSFETNTPCLLPDALHILTASGIHTAPYAVVKTEHEIEEKTKDLGELLALKIISPDIIHKTDIGGVAINVPKKDLASSYDTMIKKIQNASPHATIDGVLVMNMAPLKDGIECIVGVKKEPGLGTLIMLGMGGVAVELHPDVSFRFAPLTRDDANEMFHELQSAPLFEGFRGKPKLAKDQLIETLLAVSELVEAYPSIQELDINPLLVLPNEVLALDARITFGK